MQVSVARAARCPVTTLAWAAAPLDGGGSAPRGSPAAALTLVAGCADGGVRLFGAPAAQLGSALQPGSSQGTGGGGDGGRQQQALPMALSPLGGAAPPDGRGVVSLAAACAVAPDGALALPSAGPVCLVCVSFTCHRTPFGVSACCRVHSDRRSCESVCFRLLFLPAHAKRPAAPTV